MLLRPKKEDARQMWMPVVLVQAGDAEVDVVVEVVQDEL